ALAPPKSSRSIMQVTTVLDPPSNGSALLTTAAEHVEAKLASCDEDVQRSGRVSPQLNARVLTNDAGLPPRVTHRAKFARPSPSVSNRLQALPVLLPGKLVSSKLKLTLKSKPPPAVGSMHASVRHFCPGSSSGPCRSGVQTKAACAVGGPAATSSRARVPATNSERLMAVSMYGSFCVVGGEGNRISMVDKAKRTVERRLLGDATSVETCASTGRISRRAHARVMLQATRQPFCHTHKPTRPQRMCKLCESATFSH